ncbi:flavonol sulfotransferase-like [Apium graveolens]|uniref:flavonol sulfotransferase-like n=1 Tax=Apium graveolens TaxID=4045 RepID=UPI003D7AC31E
MKFLENSETTDCEYKTRISLLPQRCIAYKASNNAYEYQGFWFRKEHLRGLMWAQDHFIPQPASTLIASYPKSGTTWLKSLSFSIATRNKYDVSSNPLQTASPHECVPFLELDIPRNPSHKYYPEIPLFSAHTPYTSLPESITGASDCKIVYVYRDPTDTFVSWWHFVHKLAPKDAEFVSIEEAFQQFSEGYSFYGPYWEHVLGYWRASLQRPGMILFLKYENLKNDPVSNVKKLAEFIGYPFSAQEERDGVVERLVDSCSFQHMSGLEVNKSGSSSLGVERRFPNSAYFRKAKAGDWKNHLPAEMKEQMDQLMEQKFRDSGLTWSNTSDP